MWEREVKEFCVEEVTLITVSFTLLTTSNDYKLRNVPANLSAYWKDMFIHCAPFVTGSSSKDQMDF